jgi:hypothetical protein
MGRGYHWHHANVACDDCGERHTPGAPAECIAALIEQRDSFKEEAESALDDGNTMARACRLLREADHGDIADRIADAFTDHE